MIFCVAVTLGAVAIRLPQAFLEANRTARDNAALDWVDRVIRPRHYDTVRGALIGRALQLKAAILDALSRSGEAEAVRRELVALQPGR